MSKRVLTSNHPTVKRLAELWEHADRLKLRLDFLGSNCTVTDLESGQTFYCGGL